MNAPKVFFDVETPNCRNDRICSLCALPERGENYYALVDPETEFHRVNIAIHGITPDMVFAKPNFRAVWERDLKRIFDGATVVGYNVAFDLRVITKTLMAYGLDVPLWRYIDVLPAARKFFDLPHYSLSDVAEEMGLAFKHHDASEDVMMTKIVYDRIAAEAPELLAERIYTFSNEPPKARW